MGFSSEDTEPVPESNPNKFRTRIASVHFEGLERTKQDILTILVQPIFKTKDFVEASQAIQTVRQRFFELGLFRDVKVSLEDSDKLLGTISGVTNLSVTFEVEETRRYAGGIFTSASNNEASLTLELRSPSLFGRGEEIQGRYEHSLKYFSSWSATFSKPIIQALWPNIDSRVDLTMFQSARDAPWSGYKGLDRGLLAELNVRQNVNNFHTLRFESDWRYLSSFDPSTPFKIREQLGHSLKSAVSHTYTYDQRDNPSLPTRGFMFKLLNEYAGFHKDGGTSFLKQEAEFQHNFSLSKLILQSSLKFGLLTPYNNVLVTDRFFIGGPLNLRGFELNRVGPHTGEYALGANTYWTSGLHLYLPLPFKNTMNEYLRIHGFLNAGNISDSTDYDQLLKNVRLSTGLGLVMSFGNRVRLEMNYCLPIQQQDGDKQKKGLQFGVGISYT